MSGKATTKRQNELFRRFMAGIIVISFILTVIGSVSAGAQVITILYRSVTVFLVLYCAGSIIKKCWSSIEDIRRSNPKRPTQG